MKENIVGIVAGILTSASMLPQLVKIIRKKDVRDLSWTTITVLIAGTGLWVLYGILKEEIPIIATNAFAVVINTALLTCYLLFRRSGMA